MIAKKTPKADLEKKRFAFFQIGLLIAGSSCLAAFEYTTVKFEEPQAYVFEAGGGSVVDTPPPVYNPEPTKQPKQQPQVLRLDTEVIVVDKVVPEAIESVDTSKIVFDPIDPGIIGEPIGYVDVDEKDKIKVADIEPSYIGGLAEMGKFINKNIDLPNYIPPYDQGTVYVNFVVNKDGSIEQVKILRGLSKELDKAAKEVVKSMPKWIPGEIQGKPVRTRFTLPINITTGV